MSAQEKCIHGLLGYKQVCLKTPVCSIFSSLGPSIYAGVTDFSAKRVKYIQFRERAFSWAGMMILENLFLGRSKYKFKG